MRAVIAKKAMEARTLLSLLHRLANVAIVKLHEGVLYLRDIKVMPGYPISHKAA